MNSFRRAVLMGLLSLGLVVSMAAQAVPLTRVVSPGYIGTLDQEGVILVSAHPGESIDFVDIYAFNVTGATGVLGLIFNLQDVNPDVSLFDTAYIAGIALYDESLNLLAFDYDPSDGLVLSHLLSGTSAYGLAVRGIGGAGAGLYAGLLAVQRVPAPSAASLALLALMAAAFAARRRS